MTTPEGGAVDVSGDLAYDAGTYIGVFQKRDATWLFIRDTWNSDMTPAPKLATNGPSRGRRRPGLGALLSSRLLPAPEVGMSGTHHPPTPAPENPKARQRRPSAICLEHPGHREKMVTLGLDDRLQRAR